MLQYAMSAKLNKEYLEDSATNQFIKESHKTR